MVASIWFLKNMATDSVEFPPFPLFHLCFGPATLEIMEKSL